MPLRGGRFLLLPLPCGHRPNACCAFLHPCHNPCGASMTLAIILVLVPRPLRACDRHRNHLTGNTSLVDRLSLGPYPVYGHDRSRSQLLLSFTGSSRYSWRRTRRPLSHPCEGEGIPPVFSRT